MVRESIEAGVSVPWLRSNDEAGVIVRPMGPILGSRRSGPPGYSEFASSWAVRCCMRRSRWIAGDCVAALVGKALGELLWLRFTIAAL